VYIRRVKIRNVRGFEKVDLDFTRPDGSFAGWTVLAGRNGSGKSSLLRILAATSLGTARATTLSPSIDQWLKTGESKGSSEVEQDLSIKQFGEAHPHRTMRLDWERGEAGPGLQFRAGGFDVHQDLAFGRLRFLAGYGPYRRLTGSTTTANSLMAGPPLLARVVTLFREDASLLEAVTWLRELHLRHLEGKSGAAELKQDVIALLNDGLLPDGVVVEDIDSDALWVTQHGTKLPLPEMSDGYRTTAALVMDMIRNLHQCFGELRVEKAKDEEGSYLRVLHEGVVLIDEVDLHLHLRWQQRIGFWLKRHFPKIQFIVASHSPFVCQAADPKGLIRLPTPGEDRIAEHVSEELYRTVVNGSLDEAVLTDLFGLETPYTEQTEKLRQRVAELEARLQSSEATPAEEKEFDRLSARLPQTLPSAVEQALRKLPLAAHPEIATWP